MKHIITTRTADFSKIDTEFEGTAEEAVAAARELLELVKVQPESKISTQEFARISEEYLRTGKLLNGGDLEFNPAQNYVLKLITKIVRERNK